MSQYIDKDALLSEIDRQKIGYNVDGNHSVEYDITRKIIDIINTLEVKDVDLDYIKDELDRVVKIYKPDGDFGWGTLYNVATHFFELGLKASNVLTWEDMKQIRDIMVECSAIGLWSKPDEEYYQEVVKRFKAQKGENI